MAHVVPARRVLAAVQCGKVNRMQFVRSPILHYLFCNDAETARGHIARYTDDKAIGTVRTGG